MDPGHQLDTLIAEKVMGWKREGIKLINPNDPSRSPTIEGNPDWEEWSSWLPKYSTNISVAMQVLQALNCHAYELYCEWSQSPKCTIYIWNSDLDKMTQTISVGTTLSHAICLAALETIANR